jgi:hypothetical protein
MIHVKHPASGFYIHPIKIYISVSNMARKRKTGESAAAWRRKFAEVARECSVEAKKKGIRFQDCIKQKLRH